MNHYPTAACGGTGVLARSKNNVHSSQTTPGVFWKTSAMTSENLAAALDGFLSASSSAVVMEGGAVVFDLAQSKYSISGENNKCLLRLWSSERNVVRRVLDLETKARRCALLCSALGTP